MTRTSSLARRRFELMAAEYLERMGARIAARREELGLTQEDIARELPGKVTGQRVSLWERGKHRPRDDSLEALARVLQVDVSYFMAQEPEKQNGTPDLFAEAGEVSQLDRIEAKLDKLVKLLAAADVPHPPGELGRRAGDSPTTAPSAQAKPRRAADGS